MTKLTSTAQLNLLKLAQRTALKVGKMLAVKGSSLRHIHKDFAHDIKIKADFEAQKDILKELTEKTNFSILSEEKGIIKKANQDLFWIVDPLDGSLNYQRQLPICCVSIALWQNNTPVLGVIYDFNRKELFSALIGKGAWLNKDPIRVSATLTKEKGILFSGFPSKFDYSQRNLSDFIRSVRTFKKVRLLGSAALSLAYVACGRGDVYYERNIMLWDVAAGVALVLAAGGASHFEKNKMSYNVFASNGYIRSIK